MTLRHKSMSGDCAVPEDVPIAELEVSTAFNGLSRKEKLYAHHFSRASWFGSLVCLFQTSIESPDVFGTILRVFTADSVNGLKQKALANGVTEQEFTWFMQYVASFLGNMGNYLSFGDTKFVPRLPKSKFAEIVHSSSYSKKGELNELLDRSLDLVYSLGPKERQLGLENEGCSTYYSPDITKAEIELVSEWMTEKNMMAYNTRLFRTAPNKFELWLASADYVDGESIQYKGATITIKKGDYNELMKKVVDEIKTAEKHAANEHQKTFCSGYAQSFQTGDIDAHVEASRSWIKDKGPAVETYIGFIESYRDPFGVRGEFEGFVAVVNREMSEKFGALVQNAPELLKHLPWSEEFEKDTFLKPDFTSLDVLTFASSGVPAGINIPNYDNVRQSDGFKNVSLGNVLASRQSNERVTFLKDEDQDLFKNLMPKAFEVQVGLHELLGHGSGKLLGENDDGTLNFDPNRVMDPYTGEPLKTWYKRGENYDGKFPIISSSYEECRAECVGIYLCVRPDVLSIFGYEGEAAEDIIYTNWLIMCRAGLLGLEFYTPETKTWRQAHMRARYAILQTLLRHGNGVVRIESNGPDDLRVVLDRSLVKSSGHAAIGDFLGRLNVYKALGDFDRAADMYNDLTVVTDEELRWRDIVMAQKKPRKLFVQANTFLNGGTDVTLKTYEGSAAGMVSSFVDRFQEQKSHLFRIFK